MPIISFILRAETAGAQAGRQIGWGVAAQAASGPPAEGMDGRTRGEGGELRLIQWQAPSMLSPHVSTGEKDYLAAQLIVEPLMHYMPDGTLIPNLVTEVPTVENGLLAEDLKSVTYKLLDGVTWADGEPLTADDVVFTWEWIVEPANASVSAATYEAIQSMEVVDPQTVQVFFAEPNANWFEPHAGSEFGYVYPKHVLDVEDGKAAHDAFLLNPVGTGPYKIESFSPNDQAIYVINENYRDPNKPFFERVNLKGGGDAASAARSVLQTGEYDFAWNLQVEPQILAELEQGGKGVVDVARGNSVERIEIQFADPNTEVDGERAKLGTVNPTMGDKAVRQALNLAVQRDVISQQLYAGEEFEPPTANILAGMPSMESPNTSWEFNVEEAKRILEEAGWTMQGDVRAKDGVELNITFVTSINSVRQKDAGDHQAGAGPDRVPHRAAPGRRRRLLRQLSGQRPEHQPLLQRPARCTPTTPPRRSQSSTCSAGMSVRRARTSPKRLINGAARTTAATRTPSTTSSSIRYGWRLTSRRRRRCSSR